MTSAPSSPKTHLLSPSMTPLHHHGREATHCKPTVFKPGCKAPHPWQACMGMRQLQASHKSHGRNPHSVLSRNSMPTPKALRSQKLLALSDDYALATCWTRCSTEAWGVQAQGNTLHQDSHDLADSSNQHSQFDVGVYACKGRGAAQPSAMPSTLAASKMPFMHLVNTAVQKALVPFVKDKLKDVPNMSMLELFPSAWQTLVNASEMRKQDVRDVIQVCQRFQHVKSIIWYKDSLSSPVKLNDYYQLWAHSRCQHSACSK